MSCHSTHLGIAANQYAKAITDLDDAQVSSIFHRLKKAHAHAPVPDAEEAVATLHRLGREVLADGRLDETTAERIARRYASAAAQIEAGNLPDGRTWAAMQATPVEAEIAERHLDQTIRAAARHQRTNPDRLAATFRKWRRTDDYEDLEAPDPAYRLDTTNRPCDKHTARALRKLGFENYLAERLPVFTYGTLRRGQSNEHVMASGIASRAEGATVDGIAVYGPGRGFPYAQEAPDGQGVTVGDLVYLADDETGDWARGRLDTLEGFDSDQFHNSHYRRVRWPVTYTDPATGQVRTTVAWTYLAGNWAQQDLTEDDRIHSGDWVSARTAHVSRRRTLHSHTAHADGADDEGGRPAPKITYRKRAVDPDPVPASTAHPGAKSAADSAAVFAALGDHESR